MLVDTGVWYAIFDPRERSVERATVDALAAHLGSMPSVVPWPITYETLRTRFVHNRLALTQFERQLKSPRTIFVDDAPYREEALAHSLDSSLRGGRPLSLTDCLIRVLLDDSNTSIRYLATFNVADFVDVCARRRIGLLPA